MSMAAPSSWARIRRKEPSGRRSNDPAWVYSVVDRAGREHATVRVERATWPPACDQCARVIVPAEFSDARSFTVTRGPAPTTLYLCGGCVRNLCEISRVPVPEPGT